MSSSRAGLLRLRSHLVAATLAVVSTLALAPGTAEAAPPPAVGAAAPWVGLLEPSVAQADALAGSGVNRVMVPAGWDSLQPQPGALNKYAVHDLQLRVKAMTAKGFGVVLDLGLQYPPAWVFSLPGQTRFVNQYGETWHGPGLSTDIPNVVFNAAVRKAQQGYIKSLGVALKSFRIVDIRIGGMLTGELRYPPADANGHTDAMWFYDRAAQAAAPVPGWRPGTGTAAQTTASVDYYFRALDQYLLWQMKAVAAAFPGRGQQVLFPSWGLRPGMLTDAMARSMSSSTPRDVLWMISSGLDWDNQVRTIAASGIPATVYCTWVDAPSYGTTSSGMSPLQYLGVLAAQYGLPLAGENTGRGGIPALQAALDNLTNLHLTGVMYMSGHLIDDGSAGLSIGDLAQTVDTWRTTNAAWS